MATFSSSRRGKENEYFSANTFVAVGSLEGGQWISSKFFLGIRRPTAHAPALQAAGLARGASDRSCGGEWGFDPLDQGSCCATMIDRILT